MGYLGGVQGSLLNEAGTILFGDGDGAAKTVLPKQMAKARQVKDVFMVKELDGEKKRMWEKDGRDLFDIVRFSIELIDEHEREETDK